jgi:2-keto-4-pentenoate hydratase/2-oxohepta-3-ene-1,7-dioic acid hydratase in catechol pathway
MTFVRIHIRRQTRIAICLLATMLAIGNMAQADGYRLLRYGDPGAERPGLLDSEGRIRDLSNHLADFNAETLQELGFLDDVIIDALPIVTGNPRLGPPVASAGKIIAVGFNYRDHAEETGTPIPAEPVLFMKAASALSGPFDPVVTPRDSTALDYEVELAIIIGRTARYITDTSALDHIAGFAVGHDVSERAFQRSRGGQFVKGKSADTFAPLGPWLVTPGAIRDVQNLAIYSEVNGEKRQTSNTCHMIFGAATIVAYVSQFMTLNPGDVIFTGTPSGVGSAMNPPRYLQPGDVVVLGIEGLGRQQQTIAPAR